MSRRRRARSQFHEPSLVPMADMLTNTVGVVLFILIFTVLTAASAVLTKRLPMERPTKAEPIGFLCVSGRIVPFEGSKLVKEFLGPIGHTLTSDFVTRFKSRRLETEYFVVTGEVEGAIFLVVQPKPDIGETAAELAGPSSKYRSILSGANPAEKFADFMIYPDGVTAFRAARDIASGSNFGTGWTLYGANERLRFCLTCGGGGTATVQ